MKSNKILFKSMLAAAAGILLCNSCSLDEYNPTGGPTTAEYLSTPQGYGELINSCYFPLTRSWTGGGEDYVLFTAECGTDLWTCPQGDGWMKEVFYYYGLNGGTANLNEGWQSSYESINYCNAAINCADKAGFADDKTRDAKVAEAHFLRAFFNFYLVEQFGGVYLPTKETTTAVTKITRSSVDDFYALIFSDLKFAMAHLPKIQTDRGRATSAAAYELYAKACLQYAGYDATPNKTELYTEAKNAALEIINNQASYGLKLYDNPSEVFDVKNNKNNTEAIWVATHSQSSTLNPRGSKYWNRVYKQFGCIQDAQCGINLDINSEYVKFEKRIMPTRALLDLYGSNDTRYDAYFREDYIANKDYTWSDGDCAKFGKDVATFSGKKKIAKGELGMKFTRQDIADPFAENYACIDRDMLYNADGTVNIAYANYGYPALKKYEAPGMYAGELKKSYSWSDDLLFRLAETYMIAGEAYYRLEDSKTAATYFNVIRNRACKNHDGSMNVSESDINVDFILAERARELCGEYTRFMDLKRMGKTVFAKYVESNPDIKSHASFNADTHFLRPVPEKSELNYQTNPKEFQNPGY